MNVIGNLLWIFFGGGLLLFLEYLLGGLFLCLTIIGIPFGLQCFKLAGVALLPFGKQLEDRASATGCLSLLMNILWICFGGIWIALTHLVFAALCAITIIGIPFAIQHLKLVSLSFAPFGKEVKN
jgi:uncharacterized membrane protein YccF (DUF307 family)